jgi:PII-like signaling protein
VELSGPAKRLTIFVGENDSYRHHSVALEIVHRAHAAGLAGATVLRGVEGYGASNHIHTTRLLSLSDDLPLCIVIVDTAAAIESFASGLEELIEGGLVIVEDVEVLRYVRRAQDGDERASGSGLRSPPWERRGRCSATSSTRPSAPARSPPSPSAR